MDLETFAQHELNILKMERASSPLLQAHTTWPLPVQPKGRGRPRASYAQTGEFDLGLIREYRSRPALYDRSNKRFKDKTHTAQLWLQISHKLGYDVPILRDRMITLRNRYNIEKRRVENPSIPNNGSQWPLYDNLSFLSEHIRSRRSYKVQCKSMDEHLDDDEEEEQYDGDDAHSDTNGQNKTNQVKHEMEPDYEDADDFDCDGHLPVATMLSIPHSTPSANNDANVTSNTKSGVRPLNNCRPKEQQLRVAKPKRAPTAMDEDSPKVKRRMGDHVTPVITEAVSATYPKFRAFGEFVAHSLNELPLSTSMQLIERFTRELVQAALANEQGDQQQKLDSLDTSSIDEMED